MLGRNAGLLKLYADAQSGEFLGAEMIAPQAEHLAHLLAWCRQMRLDVDRMLGLPFYHPTIEEGLRSGLRELRRALGRRNTPPAGCLVGSNVSSRCDAGDPAAPRRIARSLQRSVEGSTSRRPTG